MEEGVEALLVRTGARVADDGLLSDPETEHGKYLQPHAVTLAAMSVTPCLILLGEPGAGKSTAVAEEHRRLESTGEHTVLAELRKTSTTEALMSKFAGEQPFKDWQTGSAPLHVFLDALDEGLIKNPNLTEDLAAMLASLGPSRIRVRISCRTLEWPTSLQVALERAWPIADDVKRLEIMPLRRVDVASAADEASVNAKEFIQEIIERDAQPFATSPISLRFLLDIYSDEGRLPLTKKRLFEEGCRRLCDDPTAAEKGRPSADSFRRMVVAARIAAASSLTNRQTIAWESNDESSLNVRDLIGGTERLRGATYDVSTDIVADALRGSALFSARGDDRFGWYHQTYREFLAAWYLAQRAPPPSEVERTYFEHGGPVPLMLREVAAWHATFVPEVFDLILERDPNVLMSSDTALISAPARSQLVKALLSRMEHFESHDERYTYRHYRRLEHPGLAEQLRPYCQDKAKNAIVRRAALDIAGACKVQTLTEVLGRIMSDPSDEYQARRAAARALEHIDNERTREILRGALESGAEPDPDDELLATALDALWPTHIDADTMFNRLRPRRRENYVGGYASFLYSLPDSITKAELQPALRWLSGQPGQDPIDPFARVKDHILSLAVKHVEDPEVAAALGPIAFRAIATHNGFYSQRTRKNLDEATRDKFTQERRRALIAAMLPQLSLQEKAPFRLIYNDPPLLEWDDLAWLASFASEDATNPYETTYATLCSNLYQRFGYGVDAAVLDAVSVAYDKSPIFKAALEPFLATIELASERARALQGAHEEFTERARRRDAPVERAEKRSFNKRIAAAKNIISGSDRDPKHWPWLYFTLTNNGFSSVTKTDIWPSLSEAERSGSTELAREFLEIQNEPDRAWTETNSVPGVSFAAHAAFTLLEAIDGLSLLSQSAWLRWVHVLVALHLGESDHVSSVLRHAIVQVPDQLTNEVMAALRRDDRTQGYSRILSLVPRPVFEPLQAALMRSLETVTPRTWSAVMNVLIESENSEALDLAVLTSESTDPLRAATAAHLALLRRPNMWPTVMDRMNRDRAFATAFIEVFADPDDDDGPDALSALDDGGLAGFYLTMLRLYPPEEDPQHDSSEMTLVTMRDHVGRMRANILNALVADGAVPALEWLCEQEPHREHLRWMLVEARQKRAASTWVPISIEAFRVLSGQAVSSTSANSLPVAVFSVPLVSAASLSEAIRQAVPGMTASISEESAVLRGTPDQLSALVRLAENNALNTVGNRLLGIRSGSEWLFEAVPVVVPEESPQKSVSPDQLEAVLKNVDVLLMTATRRETDALLSAMEPLPGEACLLVGTMHIDTYTIGRLGHYAVAHCQSGMGTTAPDGSMATTTDALRDVKPKVVIAVGIAFGMRRAEQRLGDVLVARHIRPYLVFKARPDVIEPRGSPIPASVHLTKWMQERTRDWQFLRADGSPVKIQPPGEVLSGDVLINDLDFRTWLGDSFPSAIGGEMEGVGAYAAIQRHGSTHVLLVKAICDWADGHKNDRAQPFAAAVAVSVVRHLLEQAHLLRTLQVEMAGDTSSVD